MSQHAEIEMPLMVKLKLRPNDCSGDDVTQELNQLVVESVDYEDLKRQIQAFITENEAQIRQDYL